MVPCSKHLVLSICFALNVVATVVNDSSKHSSVIVVKTNVGFIRGLKAENGDYFMFMGIPYATVDKGNVFGPASPFPKFNSTFDASNNSSICPQIEEKHLTIVGTLDCLHINIHVPSSASKENQLPVFLFIFGGQFAFGDPGTRLWGPSALVRHEVIVVTINYRLGPYGFMCLDIPEVPGNQGLKDQVIAFKWVKNNIEAFGGDANRITISGSSSGAICADLHAYRNEDQLFQRVILQSGFVLSKRAVKNSNNKVPFIFADYFKYSPKDLTDALSFIGSLDTKQVIRATEDLGLSFGPCVEKQFHNVTNFITEHPINKNMEMLKDIDALMGFNDDEQITYYEIIDGDVFASFDYVAKLINDNFDFGDDVESFNEMKAFVESFYLGDDKITPDRRRPIINMASDFNNYHPALRTVRKYLDSKVKSLYFYMFSYCGKRNILKCFYNVTNGGAGHADEIGYLFDFTHYKGDSEDALMMDKMTTLWTNFIKYGNPTPYLTELIPVKWPRVSLEKWNYLELNKRLRVASRPFHDRMAFLDLLYKKYEQYQSVRRQPQPQITNITFDITVLFAVIVFYATVT